MSAVDSVNVTTITMHIVMIAAAANFGAPKRKISGPPNQAAWATLLKSVWPMSAATIVPITMLSSTAICETKPRNRRLIRMIDRTTMPASTTCETWATFAPSTTVGAISEISAPPSDRPMMQMTVPATSGGKKRMIIEKGLARISPSTPETIIAP